MEMVWLCGTFISLNFVSPFMLIMLMHLIAALFRSLLEDGGGGGGYSRFFLLFVFLFFLSNPMLLG